MSDAEQKDPGSGHELVSLGDEHPVWHRFFQVSPLVVVGTREPDGTYDLAPKHLAMPLGWQNWFGFVCTPAHATYGNAIREGAFTVSFPRPSQILLTSLAAAPRCADDQKPSLEAVPTFPARRVDGVLLEEAYVHLECETDRVIDGFGDNSLITGRVVETLVTEDAIRRADKDDKQLIFHAPLLAYLPPGRYAEVSHSFAFPFHEGMTR
jgi:flavin reductase (DIM6/NTAB) family NADH-FMN oxidoreductase RutF